MNPLAWIIQPIAEAFTSWNSARKQIKEKKLDIKMAELENRARLLRDEQTNNHEWEMANLTDKDKFLRWFSFLAFTAPFLFAIYSPDHVKLYFDSIRESIPEWWTQILVAMVGGIWGLSTLKNIVPSVIAGAKKAFKE